MRRDAVGFTRIGLSDDRRAFWLALGTLTVLALALRLACMTGLIGADDDLKYARYAQAIVHGGYAQAVADARGHEYLHWAIRFGLLLPLAAVYALFGVSEWSTIVLPLVASTASVVLLALIGRRLFDWRVGMIAGLLYATFPLQLRYATVLVPEPIAECFALIGVLCYLQAQRRTATWYLAAGVAFGAAYLTKESALFVGGAFMLHSLWERQWRSVLLLGIGLIGVAAVEHAYYVLAHGDILFRPHATVFYDPTRSDGEVNPDLAYRLFKYYPRRMLVPSASFGLHSLACLTWAALALALKPKAGYRLLLLWAVVPWLYLNFGTSSFERYVVLPAQQRYIEFTYPPLMLLSGVVLIRGLAGRARIAVATAVVLAIVSVVGVGSGLATRGRGYRTAEMAVLREIVRQTPRNSDRKLYATDPHWREALNIFDASLVSKSRDAAEFIISPDPLGLPSLQQAAPRRFGANHAERK